MNAKKIAGKNSAKKPLHYVILRADSGVYCGTQVSSSPNGGGHTTTKLVDFRRIWKWFGFEGIQAVHTVEDIAVHGVGPKSKVSSVAPEITISDVRCSLVCSDKARAILECATWAP